MLSLKTDFFIYSSIFIDGIVPKNNDCKREVLCNIFFVVKKNKNGY